jgi:hypothetical protein|tara:strand:+ start:1847 stop:2146 length:300 start_codon:yes stop_codon:yes gene_type:complete
MDRYRNIKILNNAQGIKYYKGTKYPEIPLSEDDIYVITVFGDRLDILANQYYGDSTLYWIISAANPSQSFSSMYIIEGSQLRIPNNVSNVLSSYRALNS